MTSHDGIRARVVEHARGNILDATRGWKVCPVNLVPGVMGKGLALEFRRRWPGLGQIHRAHCTAGQIAPGRVSAPAPGIIFFPTKRHWRDPSRVEDIQAGLEDLRAMILDDCDHGRITASAGLPRRTIWELPIDTIAIPALGCGEGRLSWSLVRPMIIEALGGLDVEIHLYAPHGG
jgi:O-acetyl-ADP-ribose deacetylase (regulator of RNase III)